MLDDVLREKEDGQGKKFFSHLANSTLLAALEQYSFQSSFVFSVDPSRKPGEIMKMFSLNRYSTRGMCRHPDYSGVREIIERF